MLKNAFKKHPLQNRTNVQIEGGGGQRPFEQCSKKLHFFEMRASLSSSSNSSNVVICIYLQKVALSFKAFWSFVKQSLSPQQPEKLHLIMTQQAHCIIWFFFFSLATTTTDDLDISSSTTTTSSSAATPCTTLDWAQQQRQQRQQHRDHLWPGSMLINAVFGTAVTGRINAQEEVRSSLS